jgi:hypothetical protein
MTPVDAPSPPQTDADSKTPLAARITALLAQVEQRSAAQASGADVEPLPAQAIQALLAQAILLYAERVRAGSALSPSASEAITATEAMIATVGLLRGINIDLFEFILWSGPA